MMKLILILFAIATAVWCQGCSSCPENYSYFPNGKCYRIFTTSIKLPSSRFTCYGDGATLPSIHNVNDNHVLTNISYDVGVQVWLGLTCQNAVSCTWDDGSAFDYNNFVNHEADLHLGQCAYLLLAEDERGYWESTDCSFDIKATVCEKPLNCPPPTKCQAPFTQESDGRCYLVNTGQGTFDNAEQVCQQHGSHLVSIESNYQNTVVKTLAQKFNFTYFYIGLEVVSNNVYKWTDPNAVYNYTNWESGFPNVNSGECAMMSVGGPFDGQWRQLECSYPLPYICSYGISNPPPTYYPPSPSTTSGVICPVNSYYTNSGTVSSPHYPYYYGSSVECKYHFIVPNGQYVAVKFTEFDLKSGDYVDLFDADVYLIARLYSPIDLRTIYTTSRSNEMRLEFVSVAGSAANRGWSLYFQPSSVPGGPTVTPPPTTTAPYTPTPQNICPQSLYYGQGTIVSPGYPNSYGNELNCTYILQSSSKIVKLQFVRLILANYDTVTLYDGQNEFAPVINILQGAYADNSQIFYSTGKYMTLKFLTDSIATAQGFLAKYSSSEYYLTTLPPETKKCQDGWIHDEYEKYCYKFYANGGPWVQNLQTCGQVGSSLLTVHDGQQEIDVMKFAKDHLGSIHSHVWIGLKRSFGTWEWSDGTQVVYTAFLKGEGNQPNKDCAALQSYTDPAGWVSLDCNTALPFICYHYALS